MPHLRKWLTARQDWYESCLRELAAADGYGDLSRPMVDLFAHIGRTPVRLVDLAEQMGVSRQWISRLANEAQALGLIDLEVDPLDKRAMTAGFSVEGWRVVRLAVARMRQIDAQLARRIGAENLERLVAILSMDWGPAKIGQPRPSRRKAEAAPRTSSRSRPRRAA